MIEFLFVYLSIGFICFVWQVIDGFNIHFNYKKELMELALLVASDEQKDAVDLVGHDGSYRIILVSGFVIALTYIIFPFPYITNFIKKTRTIDIVKLIKSSGSV